MNYHFSHKNLSDWTTNIYKEWAITNGIGGYAGGSILGAQNRTHQGYLIASYHAPVQRYMVFSKTHEILTQDGNTYDLTTGQYAGEAVQTPVISSDDVPAAYKAKDTVNVESDFVFRKPVYRKGNDYLESVDLDGCVTFTYAAGALTLRKTLTLVRGENTAILGYHIINTGAEAMLSVTPLMNYRDHSGSSTPKSLQFDMEVSDKNCAFVLFPKADSSKYIRLASSLGNLVKRANLYDEDVQFQTEVDNEVSGLDCSFTPFDIQVVAPANSELKFTIFCTTGENYKDTKEIEVTDDTAEKYIAQAHAYQSYLLDCAGYGNDDFANSLVVAADQFLSYRESTKLTTVLAGLPWFTDWGRDTMIAFTGLTLCTGRYDCATEILRTFAQYIHHGMVPNMFPDSGAEPMYNTVDASLWYFYAVERYLEYTKKADAITYQRSNDVIRTEIYPALKQIIDAYKKGTDFSIYMDDDCLIHAGSGNDQVTWMDVRVGDWVVTPRHGKPVEINALWYNALCVMEYLAGQYGEDATEYTSLAQKVKKSFCKKFWYEEGSYLYDVIDETECDTSLRPNQLFAISLPHSMLSEAQAASIMKIAEEKLLAGPGIRSLSPDHKDYHPIYLGSLPKRDAAYHQGTAWGFLMGTFISSYMKVNHYSPEAATKAMEFLAPVKEHLQSNCIGSISEIFDGDAPHNGRGCYAQAWSIGEVLRSYTEDVLPFLK